MRSFAVLRVCALALALVASICCARTAAAEVDLVVAESRLEGQFASRGLDYPPTAVTLVSLKSEARLELWAAQGSGWTFVRSYLVQAASGRLGPKLRQGDHQVPEGVYRVSALNPRSRYHLALRLDYPNAFDQARASEDGRARLGGDIMIHGDRVSDGCLPVGNEAIEELFALASRVGVENVSVLISPVDLRRIEPAVASARVAKRPRWLGELYAELATALRAFPLPQLASEQGAAAALRARAAAPRCRPYDAADCERHCGGGDVASCARAGVLYGDGRGVPADAVKAWSLLSDACARGDAVGCGALSELVLSDQGLQRDAARAASLARAACQAGDGHGCARLANLCTDNLLYADAPGECSAAHVERLRREAVAALAWGCSGWAAYDCHTLATIYARGDPVTALRFADGSCQAGDPGGCDQLGELYERRGDTGRARALYARACDAGYARACARGVPAAGGTLASRAASDT